MGIIYDILSSMDGEILGDIAMEADDVTGDAKQGASDMNGGDTETSSDIDLDTDIFGKGDPTQKKSGVSKGNSDDNEETNEESSDAGDDKPLDEDSDVDLGEEELREMDEETGDDPPDSKEALQKKNLKKEMLHLYDVINDDIDLLSETIPNITTPQTTEALGNIKKNLVQCKGYIRDILKDEYKDLEYPILKKKHIALSHVYDLCARAIDIFFKQNGQGDEKTSE